MPFALPGQKTPFKPVQSNLEQLANTTTQMNQQNIQQSQGLQGLVGTTQKAFGISPDSGRAGKSAAQGSSGGAAGGGSFSSKIGAGGAGGGAGGGGGTLASNPDLIAQKLQLDLQERRGAFPLLQERRRLKARDQASGLTIAGELRREAARARDESALDLKNRAGRAGLIQSGFRNRASRDITNRFLLSARDISERVGRERINQINQALAEQKNQFAIMRQLAVGDVTQAERLRKQQLGGFGG